MIDCQTNFSFTVREEREEKEKAEKKKELEKLLEKWK